MTKSRNFAIDNIRALAVLLGIVMHASASYMQHPDPHWPSLQQKNILFDFIVCAIHSFRLPVFFFLAGYLSYLSFQKNNIHIFILHRIYRVAIPFLIFMLLTNYSVIVVNIMLHRLNSISDFIQIINNVSYLWFLEYLLIYYVISVLLALSFKYLNKGVSRKIENMVTHLLNDWALVLLLGNYLFLYLLNSWYIPVFLSLTPNFMLCFMYGLFFFLGWFLSQNDGMSVFFTFKRSWCFYAVLSFIFYTLIYLYLDHSELARIVGLFFYVTMSWFLFMIFIGGGLILLKKSNFIFSIVSESSYWIYLIHVPILMRIQEQLLNKGISLAGQFLLSILLTLSICLLTYPLIRNTWVGKGPKKGIRASSDLVLTS